MFFQHVSEIFIGHPGKGLIGLGNHRINKNSLLDTLIKLHDHGATDHTGKTVGHQNNIFKVFQFDIIFDIGNIGLQAFRFRLPAV